MSDLARVEVLLCQWGRRALRCESGALGYASVSGLLGDGDIRANVDGYASAAPRGVADKDMELVELSVSRLPIIFKIIVIQVYQHGSGLSIRKNAEALGINKITLGKYLAEIHKKIALDIYLRCDQNSLQSVNGGSFPKRIKPVLA